MSASRFLPALDRVPQNDRVASSDLKLGKFVLMINLTDATRPRNLTY